MRQRYWSARAKGGDEVRATRRIPERRQDGRSIIGVNGCELLAPTGLHVKFGDGFQVGVTVSNMNLCRRQRRPQHKQFSLAAAGDAESTAILERA